MNIKSFKQFFEGKAMTSLKSKDSDVKKEEFRDMIRNYMKTMDCDIKQVGNDFEVNVDNKIILQIMFRKDKITVKKSANKFGKDFEYDQLGKIKSEIKSCLK